MNSKYIRTFIILIVAFGIYKTLRHFLAARPSIPEEVIEDGIEKVKVSVYYEALCPDSRFFITNQLLHSYEELKDYLILDLIPYGKAQTLETSDGQIEFRCQHDIVECVANKIHACVIEYVKDPMEQLKYVSCMIADNMIPIDAGEKCGQELNIDFYPILHCVNGEQGSQLLKINGKRTHALSPTVHFIPTIELNSNQNNVPQSAILKDLTKSICQVFKHKPKPCM